ncbi:MAG: GNAT family protein [Bacteroidota bacterium]
MQATTHLPEFIELENKRVRLRPLEQDDVSALKSVAINEDLWGYGSYSVQSEEDLRHYIKDAFHQKAEGTAFPFLIWDKKTNRAAGSTRFCNYSCPHKRVEIGYTWLGADFHGTGLNMHVKALMLDYAFDTLKVVRVEFKADVRNLRSRKAMQKIGAVEEGILRSHTQKADGSRRDTIYYSILSEEWHQKTQSRLHGLLF